jgi:Fe2+ or Zn2+ uptake regulation protein
MKRVSSTARSIPGGRRRPAVARDRVRSGDAWLRVDLARRGMRLTNQRRLILAAVQATDTHPTAESVHAAVRRQMPRIGLGTVYRNLRLLARRGLLSEIAGGPSVRFDARVDRHHHFTCSACGRIFDLDEPIDPRLDARVATQTGFRVSHHRIEFFGLCGGCGSGRATRPRRERPPARPR